MRVSLQVLSLKSTKIFSKVGIFASERLIKQPTDSLRLKQYILFTVRIFFTLLSNLTSRIALP